MRTQKQIAASRENGGKSHGAATAEGKARIVNANFQTGIFAETQVLIWEFQVEDALWDELFTASPQNLDACAYALQQGDRTFTRLQHRINSTRRTRMSSWSAPPGLARNPNAGNPVTNPWESP
jgi:hypothetical protein